MSSTQRCKSTCLCNKRLLLEKQATRGTVGFFMYTKVKTHSTQRTHLSPHQTVCPGGGFPIADMDRSKSRTTGQYRSIVYFNPLPKHATSKESFVNNAARCLRFHASKRHFKGASLSVLGWHCPAARSCPWPSSRRSLPPVFLSSST